MDIPIKTHAKQNYEAKLKKGFTLIDSMSFKTLEVFKALVDDALKSQSLNTKQNKAGKILSEARKHLTRKEFQELESYVFEKLEK